MMLVQKSEKLEMRIGEVRTLLAEASAVAHKSKVSVILICDRVRGFEMSHCRCWCCFPLSFASDPLPRCFAPSPPVPSTISLTTHPSKQFAVKIQEYVNGSGNRELPRGVGSEIGYLQRDLGEGVKHPDTSEKRVKTITAWLDGFEAYVS